MHVELAHLAIKIKQQEQATDFLMEQKEQLEDQKQQGDLTGDDLSK